MKIVPFIIVALAVLGCTDPSNRNPDKVEDHPTITYTKPRWELAGGFVTLHFQVQNTTLRALESIKIEATFYDKKGDFVRTETPYIERWERLRAGDISPATVMTSNDPELGSVRLRFTCRSETPFETLDIVASQTDRLE